MARPVCSPDSAANTAGLNHHFDSAGESGYSGFFQTASLGLHWSRARVVVFRWFDNPGRKITLTCFCSCKDLEISCILKYEEPVRQS